MIVFRPGLRAIFFILACLAISVLGARAARTQTFPQDTINNNNRNIRDNIRDDLHRLLVPKGSGGDMRFSAEADDAFDPKAFRGGTDFPRSVLMAYSKIATRTQPAAPVIPAYVYGINFVGSGDEQRTSGGGIITYARSGTGTAAFDVTKIGIFSASDTLTFVATGSGVWMTQPGLDTSVGAPAATLMYGNGGFSGSFTVSPSWNSFKSTFFGVPAPANSSAISYIGDLQYRVDLNDGWFVEPTAGVTYNATYALSFGTWTGDSTELHGGARIGRQFALDITQLEASLTLAAFTIVETAGTSTGLNQTGGRASGKLNFLWSQSLSTYLEAHGQVFPGMASYGASCGLRYSW